MRNADIPERLAIKQPFYADPAEWVNIGNSAIVNPAGAFIAGPVQGSEEILYADLNLQEVRTAKRDHCSRRRCAIAKIRA